MRLKDNADFSKTDDMKFTYFLLALITFSVNAQQKEELNWDEARINGKLELTISKRDFEHIYKKADKIVTPDYTDICGADQDSNFQYYYYKDLKYELDNGIMNFIKITFSKKSTFFFTYKGKKLDGTTKLEDLNSLFPEAVISVDKNAKENGFLVASGIALDDNLWSFTFKNGLLVSIEYFVQC